MLKQGLNVLRNCSVHLSVPISKIESSVYTDPSIKAAACSIRDLSFITFLHFSKKAFLFLQTISENPISVYCQYAPPYTINPCVDRVRVAPFIFMGPLQSAASLQVTQFSHQWQSGVVADDGSKKFITHRLQVWQVLFYPVMLDFSQKLQSKQLALSKVLFPQQLHLAHVEQF